MTNNSHASTAIGENILALNMTLAVMFIDVQGVYDPTLGVPDNPLISPSPGTRATSPDTGTDPYDGVASVVSPHGISETLTHRAASGVNEVLRRRMRSCYSNFIFSAIPWVRPRALNLTRACL